MINKNQLFLPSSNKLGINPPSIKKKKILCWSDSVTSTTGFGIVSRHILHALYQSGLFEIDQVAINHVDVLYDRKQFPYNIIPARLDNPNDPYGREFVLKILHQYDYDFFFVINDTFVLESIVDGLQKVKLAKTNKNKSSFKFVYYYPVDCQLRSEHASAIKMADCAVAYTNFAKECANNIGINVDNVIYHGADIQNFYPLNFESKMKLRKEMLNIDDPDKFIWININRNTWRKDIAKTVYAFNEFKKLVPNSSLYLHTMITDTASGFHPTELSIPIRQLGLDQAGVVIFPNNYHPAKGFSLDIMNKIYNCGDGFITTALGEGFGLTSIEAMAAGTPVVIGNHTSTPELFGTDRGYVYSCKEPVYIDASGYRMTGRIEDILDQMLKCYNDWLAERQGLSTERKDLIQRALTFSKNYSWNNVCKQWITLFKEESKKDNSSSNTHNFAEVL